MFNLIVGNEVIKSFENAFEGYLWGKKFDEDFSVELNGREIFHLQNYTNKPQKIVIRQVGSFDEANYFNEYYPLESITENELKKRCDNLELY